MDQEQIVVEELERLKSTILVKGMAFTDFVADLGNLQGGYDARAANYSEEISGRQDKTQELNLINKFFLGELEQLIAGKQIDYLDVGCGDGVRTKYFFDELSDFCSIARFEAVDYSTEMIKLAQRILGVERVNWGDLTNLRYDNEFDLITCMYAVIGHLPESKIPTAFHNLYKSLREGGYLCIDVILEDPLGLERYGYNGNDGNSGKYMAYFIRSNGKLTTDDEDQPIVFTQRMFTLDEIEHYSTNAGFRIISEKEICTTPDHKLFNKYALILQK